MDMKDLHSEDLVIIKMNMIEPRVKTKETEEEREIEEPMKGNRKNKGRNQGVGKAPNTTKTKSTGS